MRNTSEAPKKMLAIENAVVDLQYHRGQGNEALQKEFFKSLKEHIEAAGYKAPFDENPRAGDSRLISAEIFDDACIHFGRKHGLVSHDYAAQEDAAIAVRDIVFGPHDAVSGGSLANTFHTMQMAQIDGKPVIDGKFITCVGKDRYGQIFIDDMKGHIRADKVGRQMVCHVFPVGHERILIATPAAHNPAEGDIHEALLDGEITKDVDRIAVGGFLYFTGRYEEIMDRILEDARNLGDIQPDWKPTLVITAAAQAVAASQGFRDVFNKAAREMHMVVHANTGEFRRLLNMDTEWRKPFEKDFAGLHGQDLEDAKEAHADYQEAKKQANLDALIHAMELSYGIKGVYGCTLRFVVTNGAKGVYTVDPRKSEGKKGFSDFVALDKHAPEKIAKSQIANTVGAGDNFAAGFQLGDIMKLPNEIAVSMGAGMASSVIQIPEARLDDNKHKTVRHQGGTSDVKGGLAYLKDTTLHAVLGRSAGPR